ncbi:MAG: hypothetical protein J5878_01505 [Oscillospiraceae bacterium]|nr:hypothetical protein [Oscillospiraceae bacterium]
MRGDKFMKAVVVTLSCVVACYLIFSVTQFSGESYSIYKAVRYEVGDGISTSGFLVRHEQLLMPDSGGIVVPIHMEGEKLGVGQVVANTYRDDAAKAQQERINELKEELEQLQSIAALSAEKDSSAFDADLMELMNQITVYAFRRNYNAANSASQTLKSLVVRRYLNNADSDALSQRIQEVKEQLAALNAEKHSESGTVLAPVSGYFSAVTDGYESLLTPEFLESASVNAFEKNVAMGKQDTGAVGKLVSSKKWYLAAVVPAENVKALSLGTVIEVNFTFDLPSVMQMKVERISPEEYGRCLLVLSSEEFIQHAVTPRTENVDLVFSRSSGLRVPKTALYVDEAGKTGVYVLVGAEARWKNIEILVDDGDNFIVKLDKSSTKNLWPEDEIILTTGEIFDGKVMVK